LSTSSSSVERALQAGPSGTWWRDAALVQKIGLTTEQQKKIEDAFQQSRLKLIDLTATLEKEQVTMEPLLAADRPDEAKILVQIDRIAQARAELEIECPDVARISQRVKPGPVGQTEG